MTIPGECPESVNAGRGRVKLPGGADRYNFDGRPLRASAAMPPPDPPPLNLIRVFDFYVTLMFVISLVRRWSVYVNAVRLLIAVRGRWPKLIQRLSEHSSLILNRSFFRPALLALGLTVTQLVASRVIFPQANLTGEQLQAEWWWVPIILVPLVPMVLVDVYFVVRVG